MGVKPAHDPQAAEGLKGRGAGHCVPVHFGLAGSTTRYRSVK